MIHNLMAPALGALKSFAFTMVFIAIAYGITVAVSNSKPWTKEKKRQVKEFAHLGFMLIAAFIAFRIFTKL